MSKQAKERKRKTERKKERGKERKRKWISEEERGKEEEEGGGML